MKAASGMDRAERRAMVLAALQVWDSFFPGLNPTVRDLCNITEIKSTSQVHQALAELEAEGRIKRYPLKARGVVLVQQPTVADAARWN